MWASAQRKGRLALVPLVVLVVIFLSAPLSYAAEGAVGSAPIYEVQCSELMAAMRDGTLLATDVYLPKAEGRFPTLVVRTPYGKGDCQAGGLFNPEAVFFAQRAYAVVLQDVRGRFRSEGIFRAFIDDGWGELQDGYDTIEWAAAQPWSDGQVGTMGNSYMGMVQNLMAPAKPSHLKAQWIGKAPADFYEEMNYPGGAYALVMLRWATQHSVPAAIRASRPELVPDLTKALNVEFDKWASYLPRMDYPLLKEVSTWYYDWVKNYTDGPYWKQLPKYENHPSVDLPIYHYGGWYDIFSKGVTGHYASMSRNGGSALARASQKLLMGPWAHLADVRTVGDMDFGPLVEDVNPLEERLRWFDYWLKGLDTGIVDEAPVQVFVMGANRWRYENDWPLPRSRWTNYYFRSGKSGSIDSLNDGVLSTQPPVKDPPDRYTHDPKKPVPVIGGNTLLPPGLYPNGPKDQRPADRLTLTYTSPPLEEDVEVTGPITVKLYASSTAVDTDWVARLSDVHPDGYTQILSDGIVRASLNWSRADRHLLTPGQPYLFTIQLDPTSNLFKAGHRIRVSISSSSFPKWDPNPGTGTDWASNKETVIATNTVFHDEEYPSHIILPIIPALSWEEEFRLTHGREPTLADRADRDWSIAFLAQNGRPPTEKEWIARWFQTHR